MPRFDDGTPMSTSRLAGSTYGYSGTRLEALGSSEYTLVTVAVDCSGSVGRFQTELEACLAEIVRACRASARADHLMLRVVAFDDDLHELHGFKPLTTLDPDDYRGALRIRGATALVDAAHNAVASVVDYGTVLGRQHLEVNGLVFVLTDGHDNASVHAASDVRDAVEAARRSEALDALRTVLVGIDVGADAGQALMRLSAEAGFDDYVSLARADAASLQRLASFASRSVAVASTALGSGTVASLRF